MNRHTRVATLEARSQRSDGQPVDPVTFAERAGLIPDDWQRDVLTSAATQQLLLCSRQSGKSTVSAVLAVHAAVTEPGSLILVLSPSLRQSQELFRKMLDTWAAAGEPVKAEIENRLTLELANGSRIVSLPGKESTIRGFSSVALIVVDEAARVLDELYQAVRPMLAISRGRIVALSPPAGKRGWFHHEYTEGSEGWHRVKVTAYDVPRIDPDWLEEERRNVPRAVFQAEYECHFGESEDAAFAYADVRASIDPSLKPIFTGSLLPMGDTA